MCLKQDLLVGDNLEATKRAHQALMSAYARAADELSLIRSGREITERIGPTGLFRLLPSLVRHFVDLHVQRRLRELRGVYVRPEQGLSVTSAHRVAKTLMTLRTC